MKPPPWQFTSQAAPKKRQPPKGKNSADFAGIMAKKVGNRSPKRASKMMGILDAQVGEPLNARGGIAPRSKLQQKAYEAGYGRGQLHVKVRTGNYLAQVRKYARPGVQRKKVATQLVDMRKTGDFVTLTAYKHARGIGRNVGSFKNRKGSWKKGKGGRFVGSGG